MIPRQIPVNKDDFVEFLGLACKVRSLKFSMDPEEGVWPSYEFGHSKKEDRIYIDEAPNLLRRVAKEHANQRPEGGRFRLDLQGAFSPDEGTYFLLWSRSKDLILYEGSIPIQSTKMIDLWAMMAKRRTE
jgi:hypothetical protein